MERQHVLNQKKAIQSKNAPISSKERMNVHRPVYAYCIFASNDVVNTIKEYTAPENLKLYADGTFEICPQGQFSQVLIIYADLLGYVSLFHIFLSTTAK